MQRAGRGGGRSKGQHRCRVARCVCAIYIKAKWRNVNAVAIKIQSKNIT